MLGVFDGGRGNNREWSINSVAGYAVYRTQGDVHVKAKLRVSLCNDKDDNDVNFERWYRHRHRLPHGARHS